MASTPDIYREMSQVAVSLLTERDTRIRQLERDLHAKVQENRKLTADLVRLLRKGVK